MGYFICFWIGGIVGFFTFAAIQSGKHMEAKDEKKEG